MSTRRQVMEAALVAERADLWCDLDRRLDEHDITSARVADAITRIRRCCEALGYPSEWRTIPIRCLGWWELVETMPAESIEPRAPDWQDLLAATAGDVAFHEVDYDAIDLYGLVGNYPMLRLTQGDHP